MTSQTEARLQLPKTNKFVRTNNLLSDTWLLQREFYPCRWEAGFVRRAGFMWCFSSIRQWKSVKSIETQVPCLVCGVRFCHWVVRLGFMAYCNIVFYWSFCHKLKLNRSFNNNAGLKHIFLFSLKLHVCLWCLLVHFTGCITVFLC